MKKWSHIFVFMFFMAVMPVCSQNNSSEAISLEAFKKAKIFLCLIQQGKYDEAKRISKHNTKVCKSIDFIVSNDCSRFNFEQSWPEYHQKFKLKINQAYMENEIYVFRSEITNKGPRGSTEPHVIFIKVNKKIEIVDF